MLLLVWLAALLPATAQTTPKATAEEYQVHAMAGPVAIGAEYMIHSFSGGGQTFIAKDYLTVEVALFPVKGEPLMVSTDQFRLRINHKEVLAPQSAQFVGANIDNERNSGLQGNLGPLVLGGSHGSQFPGDPSSRDVRTGPDGQPLPNADQLAVQIALPEAEARRPVSGYLYFSHRGKIGKIHSLELSYSSDAGKAILPLQ